MTPLELARQTLIQLSKSQSPPTPENYRSVYNKLAGIESMDSAILNKSLEKVLLDIGKDKQKFAAAAQKISTSIKKQDSLSLENQLRQLISVEKNDDDGANLTSLLPYLLKQLAANHTGLTLSQKNEALNRVITNFSGDPSGLAKKVRALITSWGEGQSVIKTSSVETHLAKDVAQNSLIEQKNTSTQYEVSSEYDDQLKLATSWRDLLIRTIHLIVLPQFADNSAATIRIESLITQAQASKTIEEVEGLSAVLKSTLLRAEMQADTRYRMQDSLVQMLRLLIASMGELTFEDSWLHGQIAIIEDIISKPLSIDAVYNAESSLKELLSKQSSIKPALVDAKDTIKNMMTTFVSGLADITQSTDIYQNKINGYQKEIIETEEIAHLDKILQNLLGDISIMSADAKKSHNAFQETQKKVEDAEKQISELTTKLDYISEMAHQDFLTGALNRRGMDEAIEREFNRADRHNTPISLAMLDIDHFKKINDTMGHATGDVALAHLAKVVKGVIRNTDILARYGGEEFVILLPGSKQEDAVNVITGVQRDLTKNFFLHDNNRVLITFSAGVAEREAGENVDSVLPRADAALYIAKQTGRNRVIGATPSQQYSGLDSKSLVA